MAPSFIIRNISRHLLLLWMLAACSPQPVPLSTDAYIWQRAWKPALIEAIRSSTDLVRQWRVLAAEAGTGAQLLPVTADWQALQGSRRPVVMVIRIDGQLPAFDEAALLDGIVKMRQAWVAAGISPAGVEIDHDCGSARLPGYAHFLARLRQALGREISLSITALPAWLVSSDLDAVLAQVDEAVLQVHAVTKPGDYLFDAEMARGWIARFAERTPVPFQVALPTYGSRVDFDRFGNVVGVESESPRLASAPDSRELMASPLAVSGLLASLRQKPPHRLRGIAWFRLPTTDDRRAWSPATWRAVLEGRPLAAKLSARLLAAESPGLYDLVLENEGYVDAPWPSVNIGSGCEAADAIGAYALRLDASGQVFHPTHSGLFRSRGRVVLGWLRCSSRKVNVHVSP